MHRTFAFLVTCAAGVVGAQDPPRPPAPAEAGVRLDAYLRPFVATDNFSGVVSVWRHGRPLYQRAHGMAEPAFGVPNTPRTRFHIASVSKAFTAAAVLVLADQGRLRLSDPVSAFVPGYPGGDRIRLEHLLEHRSGIPNVGEFPGGGDYRPYTAADVVALFRDRPLDFEPGTRERYTNSDYNLLALVIERVTSRPYGEALRDLVLEPAGLAETGHDGDARRVIPHLAAGTAPDGLRGVRYVPYLDWGTKTGSGSIVTTAGDLCRFADALFGGRLLQPASLERVLRSDGAFPYGWVSRERAGRPVKASGGRSPGYIANVEYFLDDGTCVAILTNSYSSVGQVIAGDVSALVAGRPVAPPRIAYLRPRPGVLAAFAGRFQLPATYYVPNARLTVRDRGGHLEADWDAGFTSTIYPTGGDEFVDRTNWAMVRFTRDSTGQVSGFTYRLLQDFDARRVDDPRDPRRP